MVNIYHSIVDKYPDLFNNDILIHIERIPYNYLKGDLSRYARYPPQISNSKIDEYLIDYEEILLNLGNEIHFAHKLSNKSLLYLYNKYKDSLPRNIIYWLLQYHIIPVSDIHLFFKYKTDKEIYPLLLRYPVKYIKEII